MMSATHNLLNVPVGKVEMGEGLQVMQKRDAPSLFEVFSRFSYEIYGQTGHVVLASQRVFLQPIAEPTALTWTVYKKNT